MLIGEQITERGIGNGSVFIITIGILSQLPSALGMILQQFQFKFQEPGRNDFSSLLVLMAVFVLVTIGTIMIIQGHRRVPLAVCTGAVGRKEVQGGNSYLPLKVNYGSDPRHLRLFPPHVSCHDWRLNWNGNWIGEVASWMAPGSSMYLVLFVFLILFFTYFWTATQFRPSQIASDMKKNGLSQEFAKESPLKII